MVALYDYDPTENSPNVDGDVSKINYLKYILKYNNIFSPIVIILTTKSYLKVVQFDR
jgi:hypothetical protein